jgi:8-oxo-dGTP pyrophosphatase MutT (NUDIX family)
MTDAILPLGVGSLPDRMSDDPFARGGRQLIPRPSGHRLGGTAPWTDLAEAARRMTVADIRSRLVHLPPPVGPDVTAPGSRDAAVLVALYDDVVTDRSAGGHAEAHVILTKRPETMPSHQGEIAFPGGKRDPGDASLLAAALREAHEEIGLAADAVEVVAELDRIGTVASRFTITPFVGFLADPPQLVPDPREVVDAFGVPLSTLLDPAIFREEEWELWGEYRGILFFELPEETVWGATARILTRFLSFLTSR